MLRRLGAWSSRRLHECGGFTNQQQRLAKQQPRAHPARECRRPAAGARWWMAPGPCYWTAPGACYWTAPGARWWMAPGHLLPPACKCPLLPRRRCPAHACPAVQGQRGGGRKHRIWADEGARAGGRRADAAQTRQQTRGACAPCMAPHSQPVRPPGAQCHTRSPVREAKPLRAAQTGCAGLRPNYQLACTPAAPPAVL